MRQFANIDAAVSVSLFDALCRLAVLSTRQERLRLLAMHGDLIWDGLDARRFAEYDLRDLLRRHKHLQMLVNRLDSAARRSRQPTVVRLKRWVLTSWRRG